MEQLETKHLAPYLPYGLMTDKGKLISIQDVCRNVKIPILKFEVSINKYDITEQIIKYPDFEPSKYHYEAGLITKIKPILRPISSMVGENGFIMFELLGLDFTTQDNDVFVSEEGRVYFEDELNFNVQHLKYETIEKLFENHFDVFGLIEKGLAININTLGK